MSSIWLRGFWGAPGGTSDRKMQVVILGSSGMRGTSHDRKILVVLVDPMYPLGGQMGRTGKRKCAQTETAQDI